MDPNQILADLCAWAQSTTTVLGQSRNEDDQQLFSIASKILDLDAWLRGFDKKQGYNWARDHEINHRLAAAANKPTREDEYNAHIEEIAKAVLAMKLPRKETR